MKLRAFVLCVLGCGLFLSGCDGSEVGNPPFQPEMPGPAFDPGSVEVVPHPAGAGQNILRIPESAVPGVVRMSVTFLDEANAPRAMSRTDGMFTTNISAMSGEQAVRVEGRTNAARIEPMDFYVSLDDVRFVDPTQGCIELETRSVETDGDTFVRARNRCDDTLTIHAALRIGDWFAEPPTQDAAPGEVVVFDLMPADLADSDTLLLETQTPDNTTETTAVTLWR